MKKDTFILLTKKISDELSDEERIEINNLIETNTEISKEYDILKGIWSNISQNNENKKQISAKIQSKIQEFKQKKRQNIVKEIIKYTAAASLLIFSLVFLFVHKKTVLITNNTNYNKTVILPDNSEIVLHQNASLSYKANLLNNFNREINFSGTGFFSIKKDNGKKFIVHCNDLNIQVLGTKFNVEQNLQNTSVALIEGKVKLSDFTKRADTSVLMQPNEIVEYYTQSGKIVHKSTNPEIQTYWLNDKIQFDNFSMDEITLIFKQYYGKVLIFDDSLSKTKHIGGSAPTDDINMIIQAISLITNKKAIIKNDTILLQ